MRPNDLLELVRRQPFRPFRIQVTDGTIYDVRHPDQIIVLRSRSRARSGRVLTVPDRLKHDVSLVHIVRIEELRTFAAN